MRRQHPPDDDKAAHQYEQWRQAQLRKKREQAWDEWNPNGTEPEPDFPGDER